MEIDKKMIFFLCSTWYIFYQNLITSGQIIFSDRFSQEPYLIDILFTLFFVEEKCVGLDSRTFGKIATDSSLNQFLVQFEVSKK